MNFAHHVQLSEFSLEGLAFGFIWGDKGEPKYLKLNTTSGLYRIKLAKPLRRSPIIQGLTSQNTIRVTGTHKLDPQKGTLKLKANNLEILNSSFIPLNRAGVEVHQPICSKILVCQKSSCRKRGAQAICHELQQQLVERGLSGQVKVVETGCMKDCKTGPNLVIMPDRKRYAHTVPSLLDSILDRHFPCQDSASSISTTAIRD